MAYEDHNEDAKVYNEKQGYLMDPDVNERIDEKVKGILGETELMDEDDDVRYAVFDPICDMVYAAQEMYCNEEKTFDEVLQMLMDAFKKLKGHEEELMKIAESDDEEDMEEEQEGEKEEK
jgi:hypothetical protein